MGNYPSRNNHHIHRGNNGKTCTSGFYQRNRKRDRRGHRRRNYNRSKFTRIPLPYNAELAKQRDVLDIIQPVLTAWRLFYAKQGIGLMNDQVLLLKMVEAAGELEKLTGEPVPDMATTD